MRCYALRDDQWDRIEDFLPGREGHVGAAAADMLADIKWQTISWRMGTKGKLNARFAAIRVRTVGGPRLRSNGKAVQ